MGLSNGAKIIKDGLIFHYDMYDPQSWKGKPTTNLAYGINPAGLGKRSDYIKSTNSSDVTYNSNHPARIKFTSSDGTVIGDQINSGVTSWETTQHCHNQYDQELKKPVYVMNDVDGNWKANSFSRSPFTISDRGWTAGQVYSISWLGWTTDINKSASCGLYLRDQDGVSRGFYDGDSNEQSSGFNTKPFTWQRLYATFTLSSGLDPTFDDKWYCYGHHTVRGTVKMSDIQVEEGVPSPFIHKNKIPQQTRSNTESLLDKAGNNTITIDSLTYSSNGSFSFDGSGAITGDPPGNYISVPENITKTDTATYPNGCSYNFWLKVDGDADDRLALLFGSGTIQHIEIYSSGKYFRTEATTENGYSFGSGVFPDPVRDIWSHFSIVFANDEAGRPVRWYQNGVLFHTHASMESGTGGAGEYFAFEAIGRATGSVDYTYAKSFKGKIPVFQIYNKSLNSVEIKQNYDALKGRFGL